MAIGYIIVVKKEIYKTDYINLAYNKCFILLDGNLVELLQHEFAHLDGILATMLTINKKRF